MMPSANKDISPLYNLGAFIYFSYLIALAKSSNIMLKRS